MHTRRRRTAARPGRDGCAEGEPPRGPGRLAWRRAAQGALLSLGAPAGWLVVQLAAGPGLAERMASGAGVYLYMLVGSALALGGFGALVGIHEDRLVAANRALDELSVSDPVTGLKNARYFRARLRDEHARALRGGAPLCVVVMDLDRFKRVNDRFGHLVGDRVLAAVGEAIAATVRAGDTAARLRGTAARMGGEEFALLLPETDEDQGEAVAERVRRTVAATVVWTDDGRPVRATISCGVARAGAPGIAGPDAVYAAADAAMYRAKHDGRNRTRVAGREPAEPTVPAPGAAAAP